MPLKNFFQRDTPHGYVKRFMYKRYLQAFMAKILQYKDQYHNESLSVAIIDGFAGAGKYSNDWPSDIAKYGSPLIALLVALQFFYKKATGDDKQNWSLEDPETPTEDTCRSQQVTPRVQLKFVEKDTGDTENKEKKSYFNTLEENILTYVHNFLKLLPSELQTDYRYYVSVEETCTRISIANSHFPIEIELYNTSFSDFDMPIFANSTRCLTFIDPFKCTDTPMDRVKHFVNTHSELYINFMSAFVNNNAKYKPNDIAALFGIDLDPATCTESDKGQLAEDTIKKILAPTKHETSNDIQKWTKYYEEGIKKHTNVKFAVTYEMRKQKDDKIIYHLLHFTNDEKGYKAMKKTMCACSQDNDVYEFSDYDILCLGKRMSLANTQDPDLIASAIFEKYKGEQKVLVSDIGAFVWFDTPCVHWKKGLKCLELEGSMVMENPDNNRRKGTFADASKLVTFSDTRVVPQAVISARNLADKVFERFHGENKVPIRDIKKFLNENGTKFILSIMEKEIPPRISSVDPDLGRKRTIGTYPDRGWLISFSESKEDLTKMVFEKFRGRKDVPKTKIENYLTELKHPTFLDAIISTLIKEKMILAEKKKASESGVQNKAETVFTFAESEEDLTKMVFEKFWGRKYVPKTEIENYLTERKHPTLLNAIISTLKEKKMILPSEKQAETVLIFACPPSMKALSKQLETITLLGETPSTSQSEPSTYQRPHEEQHKKDREESLANMSDRGDNGQTMMPPDDRGSVNSSDLNPPRYTKKQFGSFHQGSVRFDKWSRGSQCVANALVALLYEQFKDLSNLDTVLDEGDKLYNEIVDTLQKEIRFKNRFLKFDELPPSVKMFSKTIQINKGEPISGLAIVKEETQDLTPLDKALQTVLDDLSKSGLIIVGAVCSAFFKKNGQYYLFDSHSHGKNGLFSQDGTSILIHFDNRESLVAYMYDWYDSLEIDLETTQFDVLSVDLNEIGNHS